MNRKDRRDMAKRMVGREQDGRKLSGDEVKEVRSKVAESFKVADLPAEEGQEIATKPQRDAEE